MTYKNHKKKALNYLSNHPEFNATTHAMGGIAVGILVMYAFKIGDPVTWVVVLALLSVAGHIYAASKGKR